MLTSARILILVSLLFKPGASRPQAGTRLVLEITFNVQVYTCVCTLPRPLITSGVI